MIEEIIKGQVSPQESGRIRSRSISISMQEIQLLAESIMRLSDEIGKINSGVVRNAKK